MPNCYSNSLIIDGNSKLIRKVGDKRQRAEGGRKNEGISKFREASTQFGQGWTEKFGNQEGLTPEPPAILPKSVGELPSCASLEIRGF
ncbi:hypothetical protein [Scytonema sp. UIC 10036]|uniref:hypothetical protein n=1 Tax=Scytonema sp. UIC 10036 TaxID=2304196 RepID=UPI00140F5857|nr:hypothetical protein [Scytonema sp. UIC 10036]